MFLASNLETLQIENESSNNSFFFNFKEELLYLVNIKINTKTKLSLHKLSLFRGFVSTWEKVHRINFESK